jgi:dTDP-4-dehydrorhamnose reductase
MTRPVALPKAERILLLGANGQVGYELARALQTLGEVYAVGRSEVNLADADSIRRAIQEVAPSLVVNAAAYTAVDKAESDEANAFAINAVAVNVLAEITSAQKIRLIHYSTDYVFDGNQARAYVESDATDPQSVYGRSKLAGEQAALASPGGLVFRLSWVFGEHGGNFPKTMLRLARERDALKVVADQHGCPTPAALVADITLLAIRAGLSGLYHLSAAEPTTWHAFAQATLEYAEQAGLSGLKVRSQDVQAITTANYPTPAKRPQHSVLDCSKLQADLGVTLPSWRPYLQRLVALQR